MRYLILCLLWMLVGSSTILLNAGSVRVVDLDSQYFREGKPFERLLMRCSVSMSSTSAFIHCNPVDSEPDPATIGLSRSWRTGSPE